MKDHKYITAERIIKNGFVNFGRNIWLAIAAIAMMGITLTILLFAILANVTFNHTINDLTSHLDIVEYLKDDVNTAQRDKQVSELKNLPNVKSVAYTTKEQALKAYEQLNANNPTLLAAISETDNPLPASITIKPLDPNKIQDIQNFLDKPAQKALQSDPTSYSGPRKDAINNITRSTHFFQQAGVIGIITFIIISAMIIFNTIRMAIFNRRDELIIMRLLGASTAFIRGPFVVETMLYGAAAATISLIVCWSLFKVASSTLQASTFGLLDISFSNNYFNKHLISILTIQIAVGILIGAASSGIATKRYLREQRQ
jgi:cell division transport system permease protein